MPISGRGKDPIRSTWLGNLSRRRGGRAYPLQSARLGEEANADLKLTLQDWFFGSVPFEQEASNQPDTIRRRRSGFIDSRSVQPLVFGSSTPKLETLQDNFDDNSTDLPTWNSFGTVSETLTRLSCSSTAGASGYSGYESDNRYDLTNSYGFAEVVDAGNQALSTWQAIPIQLILDGSNTMNWNISNGTLIAQTQIAGSFGSPRSDTAYIPRLHRFFRMRESAGTVFWDYSPNGWDWINYTSIATPFAITSLLAQVLAGTFGVEASATTAVFDNFNFAGETVSGWIGSRPDAVNSRVGVVSY